MASECSEECNRLVFEAVYESSVSKLKLAISTFTAIEVLAGFAQCNWNGEHLLVVAIKRKNITFIDELVKFLQCQCFRHSGHPTSSSINLDAFYQLSDQIPIIELIDLLVIELPEFKNIAWLEFLAQVFTKSTSFSRQDKIIALELIGALLLNIGVREPDQWTRKFGLQWWREAMTLRYLQAEGEPLLPKIPDVSVPSEASSMVFGSTVEVMSMEQLDHLEEHFKRNFFTFFPEVRLTCKKLMQRHVLLVIRGVTSQSNSEHPNRLYLESLHKFGSDLVYENRRNLGYRADNKLIINTFLLILEQMTGFDPKVLSRKSFGVFISTLSNIAHFFIRMLQKPPDSPGSRELSYANFLPPTKFFGTIAKFFPEPAMMSSVILDYNYGVHHDLAELMFYFVFLLESISPRLSSQEKQQLEECYSNYIRDLFPTRTTTVLHAAVRETVPCAMYGKKFQDFENLMPTVKLLLKLGADPNAVDKKGQTPLHILTGIEEIHLDENMALFQALVDAGTHLDMAANNGDTVLSLLKKNVMRSNESSFILHPYYESLLSTVLPLSCYCAQVIRRHEISFDEGRLPLCLQTFVSRHSAKEDDDHADY